MDIATTIPEFPVPDFTDVDAAFGASQEHYLTKDVMGHEFYAGHHPMCNVFNKLFFEGGTLSDFNLKFKSGIDKQKAMRALRALMCSFAPKHEIKTGTVGVALANWCEPIV